MLPPSALMTKPCTWEENGKVLMCVASGLGHEKKTLSLRYETLPASLSMAAN